MQYEDDSDLQDQHDDYEVDTEGQVVEPAEEEAEESGGEGEQGARQEKAKSNFVDFDKIPDEDLRHQVKSRVGELYRQSLEAKKAESELKKLRQELDTLKADKELKVVEAPSVDLAIDDPVKFAAQQKEYSDYLVKKHQHDESQKAKQKQVEEASQQAQEQRIASYNKRVKELKVDPKLLSSAAEQVSAAGISPELAEFLLDHDYGPALVSYLGTNFEDLYKVSQMTPSKAAAYIESNIAPKAVQRKKPSAPPPPTKASGARISGDSPVNNWKIS